MSSIRPRAIVAGALAILAGLSACEDGFGLTSTTSIVDLTPEERDILVSDCERGVMAACDDLAIRSANGTPEEVFGATCGNRIPEPAGSCVDLFELGGPTGIYRGAVGGVRADVVSIVATVVNVNETWDSQESRLTGAERAELYSSTEDAFERAVSDLALVQATIDDLAPPSGIEDVHADLQHAARGVTESASAVLEGLRRPADAEELPGTARREAVLNFETAASRFFEAADLAIQQAT